MTTDHMELRNALERGLPKMLTNSTAVVSLLAIAELLAAYDALVAAGTKPKKAKGYSAEFEEAWSEYPTRPGNSKAAAFKAWVARLKAGATVLEMIEGTRKYAIYCKAEGTEPQYVKQAATFYGPGEHFSADWTPRTTVRRTLPDRRDLPSLDDARASASAEAKRRLLGQAAPPADDRMTFEMEQS